MVDLPLLGLMMLNYVVESKDLDQDELQVLFWPSQLVNDTKLCRWNYNRSTADLFLKEI